ncbi:MAG: outer membrane beta-barrel domain-containing protein [Myxococcota bacterium]
MKLILVIALLASPVAVAAPSLPPSALLTELVLAQGAASDEDEDEEEEESTSTGVVSPPPGGAESKPTEAKPPEAVAPVAPAAPTETQKLVSGAPLFNPNVAVHIVEKKQFSDRNKREVVLYPAAAQVNGKFTQHYGTAATGVYHLHENFGFQVTGQYNWYASESAFNAELIEKVRQEAQAATSLLLVWGAQAGVEVTPLYAKFAYYEDRLAHFSLVINGGAGIGSTRHQLKPANQAGPATFGETGLKYMGSLGAGFRLQLGSRFALRLEVRDLVYTARVDSVNGCVREDLEAMDRVLRAGQSVRSASVSPACRVDTFDGVDENTGQNRSNDVPLAFNLVRTPSSDVLNNVGFYAGFAFLF